MGRTVFSGILFLLIMGLGLAMAGLALPGAVSKNPLASADDLLKGRWETAFERSLGEILPVFEPSRRFWGQADFALFGQGRKGVVVGTDGWLFSDEEFSCPREAAANLAANRDFILQTQSVLAQRHVTLVVALVPAKIRVNAGHAGPHVLPPCRATLYGDTVTALEARRVIMVDLLAPMLRSRDKDGLYLRTDTHWTPAGARLAAETIATNMPFMPADTTDFATTTQGGTAHEGDLLRYLPGVRNELIHSETLATAETTSKGNDDLFGDAVPIVTLVGTSYSANPSWNFEGFLKEALHKDVLNMADQGLGPFTVMDKYLAGDNLQNTPPQVLIWEIPERYLVLPHTLSHS